MYENNKRHVGDSYKLRKHEGLRLFLVTFFRKKASTFAMTERKNEINNSVSQPSLLCLYWEWQQYDYSMDFCLVFQIKQGICPIQIRGVNSPTHHRCLICPRQENSPTLENHPSCCQEANNKEANPLPTAVLQLPTIDCSRLSRNYFSFQ